MRRWFNISKLEGQDRELSPRGTGIFRSQVRGDARPHSQLLRPPPATARPPPPARREPRTGPAELVSRGAAYRALPIPITDIRFDVGAGFMPPSALEAGGSGGRQRRMVYTLGNGWPAA